MGKADVSKRTIERLIIFMSKRRELFSFNKDKIDEAIMLSVNELPKELCEKYFPEIYRENEEGVSPVHVTRLFEQVISEHVIKGDIYRQVVRIRGSKTEYGLFLGPSLMQEELSPEEINELGCVEERLYNELTKKKKNND